MKEKRRRRRRIPFHKITKHKKTGLMWIEEGVFLTKSKSQVYGNGRLKKKRKKISKAFFILSSQSFRGVGRGAAEESRKLFSTYKIGSSLTALVHSCSTKTTIFHIAFSSCFFSCPPPSHGSSLSFASSLPPMALLQYPRTRTPISLVAPAQDIALHPSCSSSFKPPVAMPPPPSSLCAAQRAREAPAGNDSKARLGWCKTVAFSHRPNTSNGSAFPFRPDDHSENPTDDESEFAGHDKVGESTGTGAHPQSQNTAESARDAKRGTFQGADKERTLRQDRDRGSPSIGKEIAERFRDKSHQSLEGANESIQREVDKSLISFEGNLKDVNGKPNQQEGNATADTDSLWRTVFPAYMRSKDDESHDEQCGNSLSESPNRGRSHGVHGAAAARAAAAAAASARELESHVNSFMNPSLSPSISAPPCSSARPPTEGGKNLRDLISDDPIWAAIRAEARLEAEREPLLSSFLYASILAHPCFERSLGFVLANRLKNATLLATQLMDVLDDVFMYDADLCQAIRLDVQAVKDRDPSCRSYSSALLYLKGYHALQSYRVAHVLWNRGQMVLALALQSRISEVFAVDIHPAARIGKAILLDHGTGVVIGETAVVGDRVSMLQGVTLGGTGKVAGDRHPKIGEGVLIGAGATILGNIVVGRGAMVAAGSLVLKDVPPHSMVAGTPAKVIGVLEEPTPSLTMKHDATKKFCQSVAEDSWYEGAGI